jgi:hypothetical protein
MQPTDHWLEMQMRLDANDEAAWLCVIEVFERRIRERFLSCIDTLIAADSKADVEPITRADCSELPKDTQRIVVPGFAIMALCCLLIETLQRFREPPAKPAKQEPPCPFPKGACIEPRPTTTEQFQKFLRLPAFGGEFDDDKIGKRFMGGMRSAIFHEAETREWVIWREEPVGKIVEKQSNAYTLNRTEFVRAMNEEFTRYLREVRDPRNTLLRKNFRAGMNRIVEAS